MSSSQEAYDPGAPEGEVASRGQYMTKRDLRVLLIALAVIAVSLVPVYHFLLGYTESSRCTQNMHYISEALTFYATEHDGRYPTIDRTESVEGLTPALGDSGHVYTWASDIASYMNVRGSFLCPSAKEGEAVMVEDPRSTSKLIASTYGMYSPYGGYLTSLVENPDRTIIIAETSNGGAANTFDPAPFATRSGSILPDGFVVGWDNSNEEPSAASRLMTRLAFPGTTNGQFTRETGARHGASIHMLTSSGQLMDAPPTSAIFKMGTRTNPEWTVPPISRATK